MSVLQAAPWGFAAAFVLAAAAWAASLPLRDASVADIAWGWLVAGPGIVVAALVETTPRGVATALIVGLWALRLSGYIAWRHRGQPEDRRYQAIRARNQPDYERKSLYLVFGLQAALGCVVALPVIAMAASDEAWQFLDAAGFALAGSGLVIETIADAQLARFKSRRAAGANAAAASGVMASGLWRFSRHPNYFGEFCFWWGVWLVAAGAGAWWTIASPLLMSVLLLKVSGVTLLEEDLRERRPAYRDYVRRTNAFFPGKPRT